MNQPAPWLASKINDHRYGILTVPESIDLYAELIVNDCVPDQERPEVDTAIADGYLSSAGDVLGYPNEDSARVYVEGTSLLHDDDSED